MVPSAFSGPRLAPPISDTAETAATPATSPGSTCSVFRSSNRPGVSQGRRVRRRSRPTATPAAAATATHHQCPPNQPGWESVYHLPPNLITPMKTRPANAPNTPRTTAHPIRTQNSRFWVTGGAAACSGVAVTTWTSPGLNRGRTGCPTQRAFGQRSFTPDQLPCGGVIPARNSPITRCWGRSPAKTSPIPDDRLGSGWRRPNARARGVAARP